MLHRLMKFLLSGPGVKEISKMPYWNPKAPPRFTVTLKPFATQAECCTQSRTRRTGQVSDQLIRLGRNLESTPEDLSGSMVNEGRILSTNIQCRHQTVDKFRFLAIQLVSHPVRLLQGEQ